MKSLIDLHPSTTTFQSCFNCCVIYPSRMQKMFWPILFRKIPFSKVKSIVCFPVSLNCLCIGNSSKMLLSFLSSHIIICNCLQSLSVRQMTLEEVLRETGKNSAAVFGLRNLYFHELVQAASCFHYKKYILIEIRWS